MKQMQTQIADSDGGQMGGTNTTNPESGFPAPDPLLQFFNSWSKAS